MWLCWSLKNPAKVENLPSLNDLQVFLWSLDLVPETRSSCSDAEPAGHQPLLHKRCSFFGKQLRFLWSMTESNSKSAVLDGDREHERPSDCGKVYFLKDRHSIGHFRWQHQRHIWIRAAAMGSMFRQHKSFYTLQIWGFMVEAGSRGSRRIRGLKQDLQATIGE